jgi:acid stress-induced BolA-like protein IbaG/YrbA
MNTEHVEALIAAAFPGGAVQVQDLTGTGDHLQALIVSDRFAGLTMIKQHKLVYEVVQEYLDDGRIHALALKTYTPEQWKSTFVQVNLE